MKMAVDLRCATPPGASVDTCYADADSGGEVRQAERESSQQRRR
jgi:hypothetical protein